MSKKFAEHSQLNLSQVNKDVLKKWDENDVFAKSMTEREGCPSFVFYEGPPSANGMPGIHHVMARTIKDTFCRYKTMKGFQVKRKAGWDTHGLPVELGVEKALHITKEDIGKTISVAEYNAACRKDVMKFTKEWTDLTHKMGYWVDLENPYITYDNRYIETLWWLLKQLYNKGLLYKGYTIQPYSPAAGTGLSSHELNQPGCYRDVKDTTVVGQFKMKNPKPEMAEWGTPYFLAWTTTPWTLPSNTALCVGPKIDYVAVQTYNGYTGEKMTVVLAKALLYTHFNKKAEELALEDYKPGDKLIPFKVVGEYKGPDLVGMEYEQLIPWVKPVTVDENGKWQEAAGEAFRVIPGDYVTTEDGTGIVHIAPTFGADDAFVARAAGIPSLFMINKKGETRPMVDLTGKFYLLDELDEAFVKECVDVEKYKEYQGRWVKNAYDPQFTVDGKYDEKAAAAAESLDIYICMMMKAANKAFKIEKHVHNYPHCWRTDKPVLYYPLDSWFIRSTAAKERMMELNKTINWKPESTGTGRFGKWLENLNDWNLSRSRYWGTPLPIWRSEEGEELCIGSVEELYNEIEKSIAAGFMTVNPYKEKGFVPGEYNGENYDKIDLHRPYVDDIILVSESGKPMKREADLIDVWFDSGAMPYAQLHYPFENKEIVDNRTYYPADFIAEGVDQTRGWFFTLHAIATMVFDSVAYKNVISNGFAYQEAEVPVNERPEIDRWILSVLNSLVKNVDACYNDYEPTKAGRLITDFVNDNLSNWYVRLNRKRFWGNAMSQDKLSAYQTLYTCLETVARLMAPIAPFYADRLYTDLIAATGRDTVVSVHLAKFPECNEALIDGELEARMQMAQDVTSMVLALRRKVNIKVRQPLQCIMVPVVDEEQKMHIEAVKDLIMSEVNVKEIKFVDGAAGVLVKKVKCDFKKLGPKFGKQMKAVAAAVAGMSQEAIAELEKNGKYTFVLDGAEAVIETTDVEIFSEDIPGWLVANEGKLTVALEVTVTEELRREGVARELVNRIQNIRKSSGFEITDKIKVALSKNPQTDDAVNEYNTYICNQVLANSLELVDEVKNGTELNFDDFSLYVSVVKE